MIIIIELRNELIGAWIEPTVAQQHRIIHLKSHGGIYNIGRQALSFYHTLVCILSYTDLIELIDSKLPPVFPLILPVSLK